MGGSVKKHKKTTIITTKQTHTHKKKKKRNYYIYWAESTLLSRTSWCDIFPSLVISLNLATSDENYYIWTHLLTWQGMDGAWKRFWNFQLREPLLWGEQSSLWTERSWESKFTILNYGSVFGSRIQVRDFCSVFNLSMFYITYLLLTFSHF